MGNAFAVLDNSYSELAASYSKLYDGYGQLDKWMNDWFLAGTTTGTTTGTGGVLGTSTRVPTPTITAREPEPKQHPDLAWLDKRVNEMRVAL